MIVDFLAYNLFYIAKRDGVGYLLDFFFLTPLIITKTCFVGEISVIFQALGEVIAIVTNLRKGF